jgi:diguanylate cyclase (GGDEF)-like protein/PAS domain S-box-containing protein
MLTIADMLFTLFCLATVVVWYLHIPYRIGITGVLGVLGLGILFFSKKGLDSENEFLKFHSKLLENEKYFKSGFDYAASGLALISTRGHFIKVNYALCQILGFNEDELLNTSIRKLISRDDFRKSIKNIRSLLTGEVKIYQAIQSFHNKKNETIKLMISCSFVPDKNNKPLYFVAQFQNESTIEMTEGHPKSIHYDSLTKLFNRDYFDEHIKYLVASSQNGDRIFAVLLLDIDALRNVNKSINHEAGDVVIKTVAERLRQFVRSGDIIARIGGDEFAIVINSVNKVETIAQITQKILSGLLKSIKFNGREIYISGSIGVSCYPNDGKNVETLIKNADMALFKAKEKGGNNYQFSHAELTELAQAKSRQQSALNQAIVKNELQLYYQPCVNMSNEGVACVEALIRWQSAEYGLVLPDTIIPLAEESGLIFPLSEWVLRTACKQVKTWQNNGHPSLKLAINLSAYQFKNTSFMKNIMRALKESEFPPENLILEITEGLIMHDHENTASVLTKLKEEGIDVVVDNFGTGFSSFSYLTNYGVGKIKIDKSFISNITKGKNELALVAAMISMGNKLGIKVVAEGVETKEQYDLLANENCDEAQGYYIARPMAIDIMESFLITRQKISVK